MHRTVGIALLLLVSVAGFAGCGSDCPSGNHGCPCFTNHTCLGRLVCEDDVCAVAGVQDGDTAIDGDSAPDGDTTPDGDQETDAEGDAPGDSDQADQESADGDQTLGIRFVDPAPGASIDKDRDDAKPQTPFVQYDVRLETSGIDFGLVALAVNGMPAGARSIGEGSVIFPEVSLPAGTVTLVAAIMDQDRELFSAASVVSVRNDSECHVGLLPANGVLFNGYDDLSGDPGFQTQVRIFSDNCGAGSTVELVLNGAAVSFPDVAADGISSAVVTLREEFNDAYAIIVEAAAKDGPLPREGRSYGLAVWRVDTVPPVIRILSPAGTTPSEPVAVDPSMDVDRSLPGLQVDVTGEVAGIENTTRDRLPIFVTMRYDNEVGILALAQIDNGSFAFRRLTLPHPGLHHFTLAVTDRAGNPALPVTIHADVSFDAPDGDEDLPSESGEGGAGEE